MSPGYGPYIPGYGLMIRVMGDIRGGSGKTTAAARLVVTRGCDGQDVLPDHADEQETASDLTTLRNKPAIARPAYAASRLTCQAVNTGTTCTADSPVPAT